VLAFCDYDGQFCEWLCDRIGLVPTKNIRCIAHVRDNEILGVVGFDNYNGSSIQMHVAGTPGWLTRKLIWFSFDYPFNVCKVNTIIGVVPSGNIDAVRFNKHLGFRERLVLDGAHPDGSLIVMTMDRAECRYLSKDRHGQEIVPATA
jgi:hypothetical protein